ncbi:MAG: hypothetical protein GXC78_03110 [Chitinophagaceae bacterium]|nr:hypothetical protein [Chitinophagaceae bacterium]
MEKILLTEKEAYVAMQLFVENVWSMTNDEGLAIMLSSMNILNDGSTADPAYWEDWQDCINKVVAGRKPATG